MKNPWLVFTLLAYSAPAMAQQDPTDAPKNTESRLNALEAEIARLKQEQRRAPDAAASKMTSSNGRFTLASDDGRHTLAFRALMQGDAAYYKQDTADSLANDFRRGSVGGTPNRENNAARDLSSGIYFRRARFGFEGTFNRVLNYRLTAELGGAGTEAQGRVNDAWISYTGLAPFTFQIGAFTPPTNLDDGTSADDTTFLERGSTTELSRTLGGADGRIGAGVRASGSRWMGALTYTSRTVADAEAFDSQSALLARGALLALSAADYALHVGMNATYVLHPADQGIDATGPRYAIRFRDRPELRVDSTRLIDTGNIDANHAYAAGLELAGHWRNFQAQAEHFWFGVERANANLRNPHFSGYYVQGSWLLTGESRRYTMNNAAYQAPRPRNPVGGGGLGAWELAIRFSHSDFNFEEGSEATAPSLDSVRGGRQDVWTLGVNWYATSNVKLMLNLLRVDVDRLNPAGPISATPFGAAPATPPVGVQIGQSYSAIALRSQFNF